MKPLEPRVTALEKAAWGALALLAAWLLHESWQKWADPIVDSGPQWYAIWRTSLGAVPYHDFSWNYGPLSLLWNGFLFRCFSPGLMTLAWANLVVWAGITVAAWRAFRLAWGPAGAVAALAVFISVFSFSMLNAVGNYNYVLPYSCEATHGFLILLLAILAAARWCNAPSLGCAFALGLCGGVSALLKPEFMLAGGVVGMAAFVVRSMQRQRPGWSECLLLAAGIVTPTCLAACWFACHESWRAAFTDCSQAWSLFFASDKGPTLVDQITYAGIDNARDNALFQLKAGLAALAVLAAIGGAASIVNRPAISPIRWMAVIGLAAVAYLIHPALRGGYDPGPLIPLPLLAVLLLIGLRGHRHWRAAERLSTPLTTGLLLTVAALAMLIRMPLAVRVAHFGFVQAALSGMVVAAAVVGELMRWIGSVPARGLAFSGIVLALVGCCLPVVNKSTLVHSDQTLATGSGRDLHYTFAADNDDTGATVDWCVQQLRAAKAGDTVLVLPEGVAINYLSRHVRPMPELSGNEVDYVDKLATVQPDWVLLIWGDQRDEGLTLFGDPGQPGKLIRPWLFAHYQLLEKHKLHTRWVYLFHRPSPAPASKDR